MRPSIYASRRRANSGTQAGAFAAIVVDFVVYPVDTLKTRIQSPDYEKVFKDARTQAVKRDVLFRGLYQGVWSVVFSTIPSCEFDPSWLLEIFFCFFVNIFFVPGHCQSNLGFWTDKSTTLLRAPIQQEHSSPHTRLSRVPCTAHPQDPTKMAINRVTTQNPRPASTYLSRTPCPAPSSMQSHHPPPRPSHASC